MTNLGMLSRNQVSIGTQPEPLFVSTGVSTCKILSTALFRGAHVSLISGRSNYSGGLAPVTRGLNFNTRAAYRLERAFYLRASAVAAAVVAECNITLIRNN